MSTALPAGQATENPPEEKMDKSLQKENKRLRGDIKQMEMKIKAMQVELTKSFQMKDRLEGLCRELQKQNKYIKAESSAKIQEANVRGKELASEVQNNMGFMKSINENLAAISSESLTVKRENEELAKKIAILKGHYEEREQILQAALKDTNESLHKAKLELGETNLKSAEEKEKLIGEMQKLADALLQSREQIKDAKQTEITLRGMIQSYEDKFNGLQKALRDTNGSYEEFRTEMNNVTTRTKALENETVKWQQRWEESNSALSKMRLNYCKVQEDLQKSQDSLEKMKSLCRRLHNENRDLQTELVKGGHPGGQNGDTSATAANPSLTQTASETLEVIKLEFENATAAATNGEASAATKDSAPAEKAAEIPVENKPAAPPALVEVKKDVAVAPPTPVLTEHTPSSPPKSPEKVVTTDTNGNSSEISSPTMTSPTPCKSPPLNESAADSPSSDTAGKSDGEGSKGKKNKRKKNKK